jgi:8-oxo-dGTP pyrophosphatase MutT (NUDIX family)
VAGGDGNGWVRCRCGHRHWGLHGAAGLLLARRGSGGPEALLQLRAAWTDAGGTWGLPGGAADSHEDAPATALREAQEETGLDPAAVRVLGSVVTADHVDWRYTVVLGEPAAPVAPRAANAESDEVRWVPLEDAARLPLHAGLAGSWERLRATAARALADGGRRDGGGGLSPRPAAR